MIFQNKVIELQKLKEEQLDISIKFSSDSSAELLIRYNQVTALIEAIENPEKK